MISKHLVFMNASFSTMFAVFYPKIFNTEDITWKSRIFTILKIPKRKRLYGADYFVLIFRFDSIFLYKLLNKRK